MRVCACLCGDGASQQTEGSTPALRRDPDAPCGPSGPGLGEPPGPRVLRGSHAASRRSQSAPPRARGLLSRRVPAAPADVVPCVCSQHPGPAGPAPEDLPVARQPRALARLVRQPRGGGRAARGPRAELALPRRVLAGRGQAGRPCGAGARLPAPGPRLLEGRWHRVPVQHRWATGRPRQLALLLPAVASLKSAKPRCPVSVKQWPVFKDASVRWRPHGDSLLLLFPHSPFLPSFKTLLKFTLKKRYIRKVKKPLSKDVPYQTITSGS